MQIHHVALRVRHVERALDFYAHGLGLPVVRRLSGEGGGLRAAWLRLGDAVLMLERSLRGAGPESGSGHVLVLRVDDLDAWERRLRAAGATLDDRTEHTLYLRDPDGHRVGLSDYFFGLRLGLD